MTTIDTNTPASDDAALASVTNTDAKTTKKFADYCRERDVRQVMVLVPNTLGDMLKAIETRDSLKESDLVRNILGASVNMYALTRVAYVLDNPEWDYVEPWTYTPPAPKAPASTSAKLTEATKKLSEAEALIEQLKAQLAAATRVPTPPSVTVDSKGRIVQR